MIGEFSISIIEFYDLLLQLSALLIAKICFSNEKKINEKIHKITKKTIKICETWKKILTVE